MRILFGTVDATSSPWRESWTINEKLIAEIIKERGRERTSFFKRHNGIVKTKDTDEKQGDRKRKKRQDRTEKSQKKAKAEKATATENPADAGETEASIIMQGCNTTGV